MLVKTSAIVLHSFKFGESSLIIDMFTESDGRMSFIAHVGSRKVSKIKKQFFQPMSILEIECDTRRGHGLQHIKDVRWLYIYSSVSFDPKKISISLFISEFLYYALRNEQSNIKLFEYIMNGMKWLDQCDKAYSNFHLVFLMRLSKFLGFYPNLENYRANCFFDLRNGCFSEFAPLHSDFLNPDESEKIRLIIRMDYETMHLYTMSRIDRNRCIEVILNYYRIHIPDFPDIKSLDILTEVFS